MDTWKREFFRPNSAVQTGRVWLSADDIVEVEIRLREPHQVMPRGWRDRARSFVERKRASGEIERNMLFVTFDEVFA